MGYSVRNQALYAALEASFGTAETLDGSDVLQVANLQFNPAENLEWLERNIIRGSLNPEQGVYGGSLMGFTFDVELKGSGSAGVAPRYGRLLRACGLKETIVADTSVTYEPESDLAAHEGVTIGYRDGPNYRIARGCRGTVSLNLTARKYGVLSFVMLGHRVSESQASAPTPSPETTVPRAFVGATFSIGGFAAPIEALTLDLSNNLVPSTNPNGAEGFGDVRITARNTQGTVNPEGEGIDTKDYVGIFRNNTQQAIQTGMIGTVAGNRYALSIPRAYFRNLSFEDRDELITHAIQFGCAESSSLDDEFSLALT